jgi:hypothetical protein
LTSLPGPFVMLGLLLVVVAAGAAMVLLARVVLSPRHPARVRIESALEAVKQNPELFAKRLQRFAFTLLILIFILLTVVYS